MEIQLDTTALDGVGIDLDELITCSARNIKLRAALNLILRPLDLTFVPIDGYLLITSQEEAETRLLVAIYPVADLVAGNGRDALTDMVFSQVASETWATNGRGAADLRILPSGLMVVSQTTSVHDQIVSLLEALRQVPDEELLDPAVLYKQEAGRGVGGGRRSRSRDPFGGG